MDEDMRTLWCGNLSEKVTEEILYELFLQGGPVQRVSIPKDHNGKQRTYGFVTYKHIHSVQYALSLFDGTTLFNRPISMKTRNNIELPKAGNSQDCFLSINQRLQSGYQILLPSDQIEVAYTLPQLNAPYKQLDIYSYKEDKKSNREHPYHREEHRERSYHRDHKNRINDGNQRSNDYSRRNYRSSRHRYG